MKITVLIENSANPEIKELEYEHGLSLLIEFNNKKYLLDAGQSGKFIKNAEILGINLSDLSCAILSHGHYDHAGGFYEILKNNSELKVYAMENSDNEFYSENGGMHYIGIPKEILDNYADRFIYTNNTICIDDDVYLIPHSTDNLAEIGKRAGLYVKKDGEMLPDDFSHELSLVFNTEAGMVIFNSCSHGGLCNIVEEVKAVFPNKRVYAFVGGLHMKGMKDGCECCVFSEDEIDKLVEYVSKEKIELIYTGHCTGNVAVEMLSEKTDIVKKITSGIKLSLNANKI